MDYALTPFSIVGQTNMRSNNRFHIITINDLAIAINNRKDEYLEKEINHLKFVFTKINKYPKFIVEKTLKGVKEKIVIIDSKKKITAIKTIKLVQYYRMYVITSMVELIK